MKKISNSLKYILILLSLIITGCNASENSLPENWFYNSGIDSTSEFEIFFKELQMDIKRNRVAKLARKISYPISIKLEDNSFIGIDNEKEFIENHRLIINEQVKAAIKNQVFEKMSRHTEGVKLGRGVVWFSSEKDLNTNALKIKIIAINH